MEVNPGPSSSLESYNISPVSHPARQIQQIHIWLWIVGCALLLGPELAQARSSAPALYLPVISRPHAAPPTYTAWSGPIAISPADDTVWVVNPDAGSVAVIGQATGGEPGAFAKLGEVSTGGEPWMLAIAPDGGSIYVADRMLGRLVVIDVATANATANAKVRATRDVGAEPGGLVLGPDGKRLYMALTAANAVAVIDTASLEIVATIAVDAAPYALAITGAAESDKGGQLLVTHLFGFPIPGRVEAEDDSRAGRVTVIDTELLQVAQVIDLPPNQRGGPSMVASIAVHGTRAWLPHVRAAPALPNSMTTTTFAAVSTVDVARRVELPRAALHLNDQEVFGSPVNNPAAVAPAPDGRTLYLVHGGSDLVEIVDISVPEAPRLVRFLGTGKNPRGIVIAADGETAFVMNYLSRSVSVYNLATPALLAEIPVAAETLPADVLAGKILFHNATDPRLARGAWTSCASCHFDGWSDGITWIFPDGPRQTPMLWNAADTLPWHWSAALDEAQDVEETIHLIQHGLGLSPSKDFTLLGAPLADRSPALDQLAAFLLRGMRPVQVGTSTPEDAAAIAQGRALFGQQGCQVCHGGPNWTISALPGAPGTLDPDHDGMVNAVLRDVGTYTARDIRGKDGFDVPSLLGAGLTAPYLHDGSAATLAAVLNTGHPLAQGDAAGDAAGDATALSRAELEYLVAFLGSIGPATRPISVHDTNSIDSVTLAGE